MIETLKAIGIGSIYLIAGLILLVIWGILWEAAPWVFGIILFLFVAYFIGLGALGHY